MTCLVGTHSIEATAAPPATGTTRHHLANRHLAGDRLRIAPSLRIAPGHSGLHRSSRLLTTTSTTDYLARPPNGNPSTTPTSNPTVYSIWQPTGLFFHLVFPLPFMYNPVLSVVRIDAKLLATIDASIIEVFYFAFSVYSLFFAIYQNY